MERSAGPGVGADDPHPLTSAKPIRQSVIQPRRRARTSRRCRAIFRIDRFFTVHRYCGENGLEPTTLYDRRVAEFVPPDFDVPLGLETPQFVLEPLGPEHCERDYAAWTSSMDHIRSTPGWSESRWPREMTLDENRADLERHANDFRSRTGFTYTVLDPQSSDVIGCVYIYPLPDGEHDARARSWVRASRADLDTPLWRTVQGWLASDWPLGRVEYAPRT
jgi:RimJ/RimL family protein N-acetyltransferase